MSNTRYATRGSPLKHERFCSAPEYERGILATFVAKKCSLIGDSKLAALLWFLQQRSLVLSGLGEVADELTAQLPANHQTSLKTSESRLAEQLERLCVDPEFGFADIGGLADPVGALTAYRARCIEKAREQIAFTTIAQRMFELLDFAFNTRSMVLAEGDSRLGKSRAARTWCEMHPGLARYVEIPASNDDRTFYATVAESLGVAKGSSYNGQQINLRVMEVLKNSRLMLVLDEAQFLWPQYNRPHGTPARIQWVKTLFDAGVPMGLVAMPEFSRWQQLLVEKTNWSDAQFRGRLSRYVRLPLLTEQDLTLIARQLMPAGNVTCIKLLVGYAISSKCNASAVAETLKSARYRARNDGHSEADVTDIKKAIQEDQLPTERALLSMAKQRLRRNGRGTSADTPPNLGGVSAAAVFDGSAVDEPHLPEHAAAQ
ncbi:MAG: ATP-binding protein [Verrucomicrobia bacterium]|nr:ATP-binding protein [Verrucomicrobiota bacterium]